LTGLLEYLGKGVDLRATVITLPRRIPLYTLFKAPMAHKTFAKEQFTRTYYKILFQVTDLNTNPFSTFTDVLFFYFLLVQYFPFCATNLLFLKKLNISLYYLCFSFLKLD